MATVSNKCGFEGFLEHTGCATGASFVYNGEVSRMQTSGGFLGSGDKELLELLDRSGAELYALLTKLTLREDVAEELMQDLFIKLKNARSAARAVNLDAYARRAAINLAFDWRRTSRRAALRLGQIAEPVAGNMSPLSRLIQSEEMQGTLNAIGRLKRSAREALVMRYIQQQSYEDIARQMGKTSHQVRAMCSRSIGRLRDMLGSNHRQSVSKEIGNVHSK